MFIDWIKNPKKKLYMKRLYRNDKAKWRVVLARDKGVKVGKNCRFYSADFFSEPYLVEIGDNVIISGRVIFLTHDGAIYLFKDRKTEIGGTYGRIKVGNNCFIGMGAIIMRNTIIGNNCIIGAGAVVRENVPDNSVVFGNPAKVIFKTSMLQKLIVNDKGTIKTPFKNSQHKIKMIIEHFKLDV